MSDLSPSLVKSSLADMVKSITPEKQHSLFENESMRIIYQPVGSYYLSIATAKTSNTVIDVECLKLIMTFISNTAMITARRASWTLPLI